MCSSRSSYMFGLGSTRNVRPVRTLRSYAGAFCSCLVKMSGLRGTRVNGPQSGTSHNVAQQWTFTTLGTPPSKTSRSK